MTFCVAPPRHARLLPPTGLLQTTMSLLEAESRAHAKLQIQATGLRSGDCSVPLLSGGVPDLSFDDLSGYVIDDVFVLACSPD